MLSPIVARASIDELYLDIPRTARMLHGEALEVTARLVRWLGDGRGTWLARIIRGIDTYTVVAHESSRSLSSENTLGRNVLGDEEVERELLRLSRSVATSIRSEGLSTRTVTVKLRDPDFTTRSAGRTLSECGRVRRCRLHGRARAAARPAHAASASGPFVRGR